MVVVARWLPPPIGVIKLNFYVAVRPNFSVKATICRDCSESVIGARVMETQVADAVKGEIFAAQLGIDEATSKGFC